MVTEKTETLYQCPYCESKYSKYSMADSCAESCADIEEVEEVDGTMFICDVCGKKYEEEDNADECEAQHELKKDKLWLKYEEKERFRKLKEVGNHPYQKKLMA